MEIYHKISSWFTAKRILIFMIIGFMLSLVPIVILAFFDRASGDDYGYGALTRDAWIHTQSFIAVGKAAMQTVKQYFYGWQGTWFSIFLFSLQPEVFSEYAYVITPFLMLFLWIGSTVLLLRYVCIRMIGLDQFTSYSIIIMLLLIGIQFVPGKKSAIFWFNGAAHYLIPYTMCLLLLFFLFCFHKNYDAKYFFGITVIMFLLGGANYQAALFSLIVCVYGIIVSFYYKQNKKVFLLLIPIILESAGLLVSMKAPGNKVRGGETFGFSLAKVVETILGSFVQGVRDLFDYAKNQTIIFILLFLVFVLMLEAWRQCSYHYQFKHSGIFFIGVFGLYCAMQAPALYAGVDVSGGVYNMNFQVFLLFAFALLLWFSGKLSQILKKKGNQKVSILLPAIGITFLLILVFRSDIRQSTFWMSYEYLASGQAADYKEQMDLQTKIMLDEQVTDAVLPFINDVQGPLMHMPATEHKEAWTNTVMRQFYGKNSVIAMERPLWEATYQK